MDDVYFLRQRRRLLATLGGALALPLIGGCASGTRTETGATASAPGSAPGSTTGAPALEFEHLHEDARPEVFLTVTSAERDVDALKTLVRSVLLPALAPLDIAHVYESAGDIQLWIEMEPRGLDRYGIDSEEGLKLLAAALDATITPMAGRHGLEAWALVRPRDAADIEVSYTSMRVPGDDDAPLFAFSRTHYSLGPPAWDEQARVSLSIEGRSRLMQPMLQRCQALIDAAGATLPADVEIQLGETGKLLKPIPTVYVTLQPVEEEHGVPACCGGS